MTNENLVKPHLPGPFCGISTNNLSTHWCCITSFSEMSAQQNTASRVHSACYSSVKQQ